MISQKLVADESVSMSMSFADACLVRMSEQIMKKIKYVQICCFSDY